MIKSHRHRKKLNIYRIEIIYLDKKKTKKMI